MDKTIVAKCKCKHDFQDAKFGIGNRVFNYALKKSSQGNNAYRCTVCLEIQIISDSGKVVESKKK